MSHVQVVDGKSDQGVQLGALHGVLLETLQVDDQDLREGPQPQGFDRPLLPTVAVGTQPRVV